MTTAINYHQLYVLAWDLGFGFTRWFTFSLCHQSNNHMVEFCPPIYLPIPGVLSSASIPCCCASFLPSSCFFLLLPPIPLFLYSVTAQERHLVPPSLIIALLFSSSCFFPLLLPIPPGTVSTFGYCLVLTYARLSTITRVHIWLVPYLSTYDWDHHICLALRAIRIQQQYAYEKT